ncbi:undecaprenyl-phosphate 4-deoxy-4-formamido-L-arabinose transferase [Lachnospiraceae bacterium G11]|nr:undecaprenyl-phosphate 4-deoxy-4-formamido-L-arabinose transferase [Lachnospiraceae bacterium G11]
MQRISFVIPCYRSALTIEKVVKEIEDTMPYLPEYDYEIVLVNDSSPDDTFEVISKLALDNEKVLAINLARNFGQHAALMAGFRHTTGDIVVALDDDGQTPADEVGKLIEKLEEGYDVCYAKYDHKKHSCFRNFGSKVNERMTRVMLGKSKELYISSYFAVKRFILNDMLRYENCYPYVIGLVLRTTKNICNVNVNHREREIGTSGYTMKKLLALWMNGFTAFSVVPLRIATYFGLFCAAAGFVYTIVTIIRKIIDNQAPMGYPTLICAVMIIGGVLMMMLGLIGEYIGRMYITMNNAPQYVIKDIVGKGFDETKE